MLTALTTAASGLAHASRRLEAAAHNAANLDTPETVRLRALARQAPGAAGVVTEMTARLERRAELGSADPSPFRDSTAAVAGGADSIATVHHAGAGARVVRTADDMAGALIDLLG